MTKRYAIVNKKNITPMGSTTASRYPITAKFGLSNFPIKRKLATRAEARAFKRSLRGSWSIVDLATQEVVR